jgi:hypothetical protein
MRQDLPQLSIGDAFDEAFDLYKRNFGLFVGTVALLYIPADLILSGSLLAMRADQFTGQRQPTPADIEKLFGIMGVMIVAMAVFYILIAAISGAITVAASERYLERPITRGQALGAMLRALPRLLAAWFVVGLIMTVAAFILLLVLTLAVGIFVGALGMAGAQDQWLGVTVGVVYVIAMVLLGATIFVWLGGFVTQSIMLEQAGPMTAIQRNIELVRGRAMHLILGFIALVVVILTIQSALLVCVQLGLQLLVFPWLHVTELGERITEAVIGGILSLVVQPLWMTWFTVLYYDLRVRKEGFDLALMMLGLDERRRAALADAHESAI